MAFNLLGRGQEVVRSSPENKIRDIPEATHPAIIIAWLRIRIISTDDFRVIRFVYK